MGVGRGLWCAAVVVVFCAVGCRQNDSLESAEEPSTATCSPRESDPDHPALDPTPVRLSHGLPSPAEGMYTDQGVAAPDQKLRGLISFDIRDREALEEEIRAIYDPADTRFRQYLSADEWISRYAPRQEDVDIVAQWVNGTGMKVERTATNRLLLSFSGTVKQFNDAFGVELHVLDRTSSQGGNEPHEVFGLVEALHAPKFVMERIHAVVALDLPSDDTPLPGEGGEVGPPAADLQAFTPKQLAAAYGLERLNAQGFRGEGARLGVAIGAGIRLGDLRSFWEHLGISRQDPVVVQTMEPPATRYREGTLAVQWAGAMAPGAELVVYLGPDARNTSMLYTFNEAIARDEVDVLSDSFAYHGESEPSSVYEVYAQSAAMAAALGITVTAAAGDSSPYVTVVRGTDLVMNGMSVTRETVWESSGIAAPRADVALVSGENDRLGSWWESDGPRFASPVFAAIVATIDGARLKAGKPRLGSLNRILYTDPVVQRTFRDITEGGTLQNAARPGWDVLTGWGAPNAEALLTALP